MRTAGRCPPLTLTRPTPADLRDLLREPGLAEIFQIGQRHGFRRDRQRKDRRVGRIDLRIDRRSGQVGRQQVAGSVDGRLHFLFGDVE